MKKRSHQNSTGIRTMRKRSAKTKIMALLQSIVPYPLLSAAILIMWLLLTEALSEQVLPACLIAVFCGQIMTFLQPPKTRIRKPHLLFLLFFRVASDIVTSNLSVAKIVLTGGKKKHPSGFITLTLHLQNSMAVALLACILTATPGTAWIAYNHHSKKLILHILDLQEEAYWHTLIKTRYENLLTEIFI